MSEPIRPIRTEADHAAALAQIDALFAAAPGSPDAIDLKCLRFSLPNMNELMARKCRHIPSRY